jgi:hypothetical protein
LLQSVTPEKSKGYFHLSFFRLCFHRARFILAFESLGTYRVCRLSDARLAAEFDAFRQAKIALRGDSEEQLLELEAMAKSLNLCARSIQDAFVVLFCNGLELSAYHRGVEVGRKLKRGQ